MVHELGLEPPDQLGMAAEFQIDICESLEREQPHLVESCDRRGRPTLSREIRERRAAPKRERLTEVLTAPAQDQMFEPFEVELTRFHMHHVAGCSRFDPIRSQRLAQRRDPHVK